MTKRRNFSREFKLAAVKKVIETGLSTAEIARDLGVSEKSIHNWKRRFEADGTIKAATQAEIERLREEIRQLNVECDILREAKAFSAKENN